MSGQPAIQDWEKVIQLGQTAFQVRFLQQQAHLHEELLQAQLKQQTLQIQIQEIQHQVGTFLLLISDGNRNDRSLVILPCKDIRSLFVDGTYFV